MKRNKKDGQNGEAVEAGDQAAGAGDQGEPTDSDAMLAMLRTLDEAKDKIRRVLVEIERFESAGLKFGANTIAGRVQLGTAARLRAQHGLPPQKITDTQGH